MKKRNLSHKRFLFVAYHTQTAATNPVLDADFLV